MNKFLGLVLVCIAVMWFIYLYKRVKKVELRMIFYISNAYRVVNQEKFILLQKIKYFANGISYLIIGTAALFWDVSAVKYLFLIIIMDIIYATIGRQFVE